MRLLLLLLFVSSFAYGQMFPFPGPGLPSTGGGTNIALIAHGFGHQTAGTGPAAFTFNSTGASNVFIWVADYQNTTEVITDVVTSPSCPSPCNTWTKLTDYCSNGGVCSAFDYHGAWYYITGTVHVGSGHTITNTLGANTYMSICGLALSNTNASPIDQQAGTGASPGGTTFQPGSLTFSTNGAVLTGATRADTSGTWSIDSGFNLIENNVGSSGNYVGANCAYKIETTSGSENPTITQQFASEWAAGNLSIKH